MKPRIKLHKRKKKKQINSGVKVVQIQLRARRFGKTAAAHGILTSQRGPVIGPEKQLADGDRRHQINANYVDVNRFYDRDVSNNLRAAFDNGDIKLRYFTMGDLKDLQKNNPNSK